MIKQRSLNGSFALENGLGNTFNLSDIPLNAVHVTVQIFRKGL